MACWRIQQLPLSSPPAGGQGQAHLRKLKSRCMEYPEVPVWIYTLWLFNIAMENGPFIDGLPVFTY